ncbi:MAG: phosphate ABC transporter permease PstA [Oligoflexus sp.]
MTPLDSKHSALSQDVLRQGKEAASSRSPADSHASSKSTQRRVRRTSLMAHGEPWVWLTGGALVFALLMIFGFVTIIFWNGAKTFWPGSVYYAETHQGDVFMGELARRENFRLQASQVEIIANDPRMQAGAGVDDGYAVRSLLRTGNFDISGSHYKWINHFELKELTNEKTPWALVVERMSWGRLYGYPESFLLDGEVVATTPNETWQLFQTYHGTVRDLWQQRRELETNEIGRINRKLEQARLSLRRAELEYDVPGAWSAAYYRLAEMRKGGSPEETQAAEKVLANLSAQGLAPPPEFLVAVDTYEQTIQEGNAEFVGITAKIAEINQQIGRYQLEMKTAQGQDTLLALEDVVRAYPANQLNLAEKVGVYLSRWWEFLTADPREANSEGGVFPALFGTVVMTLLMSIAVVPFGVLAALYLREYAKAGPVISAIRIAINNLAGVPSIVFGVFGLGFFCYIVGGGIDQIFYPEKLPNPTFGTGGLLWASLTLALLTLPVVIVATEEALAAVPSSMREGSYACGASKWQTIQRIVLPRAMPGIMTGMILAMARGAGEVAPLMLVGAVKLAPELPIDGVFPFIHPERSFMHLGFHIYDLGFQSQNSEAAKPMVFTTTLLLISMITFLNISAVTLRSRLRRRFMTSQF